MWRARSLGQGRRAGLISALGISAGCLVHIVAAAAGVAVLLRAWPRAYSFIRLAGAAYLIYLGVSMLWSAGRGEPRSCRSSSIPREDRPAPDAGGLFNVSGTLVNAAVAWLAGAARGILESRAGRAWFQRASGAILTALGLRLALAR